MDRGWRWAMAVGFGLRVVRQMARVRAAGEMEQQESRAGRWVQAQQVHPWEQDWKRVWVWRRLRAGR